MPRKRSAPGLEGGWGCELGCVLGVVVAVCGGCFGGVAVTVDEVARLLHRELNPGGYARSWEGANPSERLRVRKAAEVLLNAIKEGVTA